MPYKKKPRCKRGHLFNESNTLYGKVGQYEVRRCRKCRSIYDQERYHNNDTIRTLAIKRGTARYYAKKACVTHTVTD